MENISKNLHPRNKFNKAYNIEQLAKNTPDLRKYIIQVDHDHLSIDFTQPEAVFHLNKALLKTTYGIKGWRVLPKSLVPTVPGRLNYIHYLADLLGGKTGRGVHILDIGTGSSIIYPILGVKEYGWLFTGSETHVPSLMNGNAILKDNPELAKSIRLRQQNNPKNILKDIILPKEYYDAIICNPPFFKSQEDHEAQVSRKNKNLRISQDANSNYQGLSTELWTDGGEKKFITQLIYDSFTFKDQIGYCTTLVSNKENIKPLRAILEYHKVEDIQMINMSQGNKINRILAWKLSDKK